MSPSPQAPSFVVLGAGVIGLTTALTLRTAYPDSPITVTATHFPGDRSLHYTSPWAGANWSSFATDSGPLEHYDRVTFERFARLVDDEGRGAEIGVGRLPIRKVFDSPIEDVGILSEGTGKVWYEELLGGMTRLKDEEVPEGAVFGVEFKSSWRIDTGVYLNWLQAQALAKGIKTVRRTYASLSALLRDFPRTAVLVNCSALGSLTLSDVRDENMYPTRGQTVLVAEPKVPIERMYLRSPKRVDPTTTYVFPRPNGGGVILGGSRQDHDWSGEVDMDLSREIMRRCCELCPELGRPEELQVIAHNVGLRPNRKGGPRIELEKWTDGTPVVHNYGHAGFGFQSSWGTAERALELVKQALEPKAKL